MSTEETSAMAMRWMDEVWQKTSPAAIAGLLSHNLTFSYGASGTKHDREAYKRGVKDMRAGLPDIEFTTEGMVVERDRAAVFWKGRGTHGGGFVGLAPAGKRAVRDCINIIRVAGGRTVEEVGQMNGMEIMQTLGAPAP